MKAKLVLGICGALLSLQATAGQLCGKQRVADNVRTCPNGDMPMFVADEVKPYVPPAATAARNDQRQRAAETAPASLDDYFGVWRTRIPGAVWTSPSGYRGYDWLHVSAGVSAGDLIIKPNGTYVWASYGGKAGRWTRSDDAGYPIVLIDTVENRQWKVGLDPKHTGGRDIIVWDGGSFYYDGRK